MPKQFPNQYSDFDSYPDPDYDDRFCHHRNWAMDCELCDEELESRGGIDKCLNCGAYKYGDELNADQVCKIPCRNPNEW